MTAIYHLARRGDWDASQGGKDYRGGMADGFIHFSTAAQLAESAALHCAGIPDLLVVAVHTESLGAALRWEDGRNGDAFPHLYGPLPLDAVFWARAAPLGGDGRHELPDLTCA